MLGVTGSRVLRTRLARYQQAQQTPKKAPTGGSVLSAADAGQLQQSLQDTLSWVRNEAQHLIDITPTAKPSSSVALPHFLDGLKSVWQKFTHLFQNVHLPSVNPTPAPPATQPTATGTVRKGSSGPDVTLLQQRLQAAGFNPGPVDGDFGPQTDAAVRAFQQARGLSVDGVVGPQTWGALGVKIASPPPVSGNPGSLASLTPDQLANLGRTNKQAFFDALRPAAEEAEKQYGVPAAITLAQAAIESGWGAHAIGGYNIFGIKGTGPAGTVNVPTQEYVNGRYVNTTANFAKYHNFYEAVVEHGKLFHNGYYNKAINAYKSNPSPELFAQNIQGIYATSPTYAQTLISIMRQYHLE